STDAQPGVRRRDGTRGSASQRIRQVLGAAMSALIRSQRKAAQEPQDRQAARGQQYLTFSVTGELFGVAIVSVKEIIEYRATTEVPMMPQFMRGIINLRGRVVPVIDLAVRFGRARSEVTARSCIVIVEAQQNGEQ